MNKKDLMDLRKEFKIESYALPIKDVYTVYIKKDNGHVITKRLKHFGMMDIEERELYLNNFKKVLTGSIDEKIFELNFNKSGEGSTRDILYNALNEKEDIKEISDILVNKITKSFNYNTDIVINFIKAKYYKPNIENVSLFNFILCSINKVDIPKKALKFDYSEMDFKANSALDTIINLNSPIDGFVYPSFSNECVDFNKVIYYSHKSGKFNNCFVGEVLDCNIKATSEEEKKSFNSILKTSLENEVTPEVMQEIYENINEKLENVDNEQEAKIDMKEVSNILLQSGIENLELVKNGFEEVCGGDYPFTVKNILPDFKNQSIKIKTEDITMTIAPGNLNRVSQLKDKQGRKCLKIILSENVAIEGINLKTEDE